MAFDAAAYDKPVGAYVCTVEQKAGIGQETLEGADPPRGFVDERVTTFRIVVTPATRTAKACVAETPYSGSDRDKQHWQTQNAVLHSAYVGDGWSFQSAREQAFFRLDSLGVESGWLFFYHSGFERPDADHLNLSVRTGTCAPDKAE